MKPIIKYRGGKSKEIPQIIQYIPQFDGRYIEPFLGGGAMFFHLEPNNAIINDINVRLINFYRSVQQDFMQLSMELAELENIYSNNRLEFDKLKKLHPEDRIPDENETLYYQLRDMYNGLIPSTYSDAALYYFINKTAFSGMIRFNAKGEYNVPYGRYKNLNTKIITEAHHALLVNTEIHNTDYSDIFNLVNPDDFVFLDPPYDCIFSVSIRRTTGFEPFYTTIATVTINRIVAVAIVLLNLYVAVGINCQILQPVWSTHFPDVATSIGAEAAL